MLNDILLLAMISNAKNRHINLWANLPYHAKKTRSGTRSGTELWQWWWSSDDGDDYGDDENNVEDEDDDDDDEGYNDEIK